MGRIRRVYWELIMAGTLTEEQYQQQQLNRQQKMAELLMAQGSQGQPAGQMISGRYVPNSWAQNLVPVAQMLTGAYLGKKGDEESLKLAEQLRGKQAETLQGWIKSAQGTPATYGADIPTETYETVKGQMITPESGPNYGEMLKYAASPYASPMLQAAGADLLKTHNLPEGATLVRPNLTGGGYTTIAEGAPKKTNLQKDYEAAKAQGYQGNLVDFKKTSTPSMTAITNVQAFEPFKSKAQGQMGEVLIKNFETLQNIPTAIRTLDRAAELAPQSFAGSFGEQKLELAKFFNNNLGTNINPNKVANTEELRSALFTNVMENLKKLDASPSQEQQRVLQQSMGSLATDPTALPRVINTYKQILIDKAETHNKKVSQAESGPAKMEFPFDIRIPLQNTGGMPSQSAIDAEIARRRDAK